jgi:hypothetical protein
LSILHANIAKGTNMNESINRYAELAERARAGDEQARRQFVRELAPCLTRMVRHSTSLGAAARGPLGQIQAVVHRLMGGVPAREGDAAALAQDLSRIISAQIWSGATELCTPTAA